MRLFIAIELTNDVRKKLSVISRALKERSTGGRFVPLENMHVTLFFIGESDDLGGIASAMREACRGIRPFTLSLGSYGFFEKTASGNHRVSLVSVKGDIGELNVLRDTLSAALAEVGLPGDRKRFSPHITLGRNVSHDELAAGELERMELDASMTVTGITLFESTKQNGKPVYIPLHRESF